MKLKNIIIKTKIMIKNVILNDFGPYEYNDCKDISIKFYNLPEELEYLSCENFNVIDIDNLPPGLKKLKYNSNGLRELNNLPLELKYLDCSNNKIKSLDFLPVGLVYLICANNHLTRLDNLPSGLKYLITEDNNILEFRNLPDGLQKLNKVKFYNSGDVKKSINALSGYKKYILEQMEKSNVLKV